MLCTDGHQTASKRGDKRFFTIFTSLTKAGTLTRIDPAEKCFLAKKKHENEEIATFGVITTDIVVVASWRYLWG